MSEINDALKRARQAPVRDWSPALPPRRPVVEKPSLFFRWVMPSLVIILILGALFSIGWAAARHNVRHVIAVQNPITAPPQVQVTETVPVSEPSVPPAMPVLSAPEPPPPVAVPDLPKLQGIFYSPTAPTAILDGKTISPGDQFGPYRVKEISKYAVTLTDAGGKEIKIDME